MTPEEIHVTAALWRIQVACFDCEAADTSRCLLRVEAAETLTW